jgi:hypothetical protein
MRYGNCEKGLTLWIIGVVPLLMICMFGMPFMYKLCVGISVFITFFAQLWPISKILQYRLSPLLDEAKPHETVWLRFTKDHIFVPQFVPKGTLGNTKGLIYGEKADVLDDGDFPVKTLNGNSAIIQYDMINTAIDLRKSVGRRIMKKRFKIASGINGYNVAQRDGKIMYVEPENKDGVKT